MLFTEIPLPIIQLFKERCKERLDRVLGSADEQVIEKVEKNETAVSNINFSDYKSVHREVVGMGNTGTRYLSLLKISVSLFASVIYFSSTYWAEFGALKNQMSTSPSNVYLF